jgi:hypothetical protein
MKKAIIILTIFMVMGAINVYANGVELGVKGGGNLGWLSGSDWDDVLNFLGGSNSVRFGITFGIFLDIPLASFISIQPEVLFLSGGGAYTYPFMGTEVKGRFTANTFEIPIYLKPKIRTGSGVFYFFVGPDLWLILGDMKLKESANGMSAEADIEPDNSTLFGVAGGIGYAFSGGLLLEIKYNRTLTEVFENDNTRFNGVGFFIGYSFSLKK